MTVPEVTVVDPHHRVAVPPAVRPPSVLRRGDRLLAGVAAAVLLLGLLAARNLRADPEVTATVLGLSTSVDRVAGVLQLDLVLTSRLVAERPVTGLRVSGGWRRHGLSPTVTGTGVPFVLVHDAQCDSDVEVPEELVLVTPDGDLEVPVRDRPAVTEACDPFGPDEAVRAVSGIVIRTPEGTRVRTRLVNLATTSHTVETMRFPGFAFRSTQPLPLALAPRDRRRPAVLKGLTEQELVVDAEVADCGSARAALDGAQQSGHPDQVELGLTGEAATIDVPGISSYLELQWQAACVR